MSLMVTTELVTEECCFCGMLFAMTRDFQQRRLRDKQQWFCPRGHSQVYLGESDQAKIKRLERQVANAEEQARIEKAAATAAKAAATKARNQARKLEQRTTRGVCPHPDCHRSFVDVARHVRTKHPEMVEAKS